MRLAPGADHGRVLDSVLVRMSPFDPRARGAVSAGPARVAAVACHVAACCVAGIDPAQSLREG